MSRVVEEARSACVVAFDETRDSLSVTGSLDDSRVSEVLDVLGVLAREHDSCVSLDLGLVERIGIEVMKALADGASLFAGRNRRLRLHAASEPVKDVLSCIPVEAFFCLDGRCLGDQCPRRFEQGPLDWHLDVFTLPSDLTRCREARKRVHSVAEAVGFCEDRRSDIATAVGEATVNAVKHGQRGEDSSFTVICAGNRDKMCVSIRDDGPGFDLHAVRTTEPGSLAEGGRGIGVMNALMDEVSYSFASGTTVRMVKLGSG